MNLAPEIVARADGFAGRGWVARRVADWITTGSERFLAITGEPGSGKTALAAWLAGAGPAPTDDQDADALQRVRESWTASHFCIPLQDGTVDAEAFGASIAGQLARRLGDDYLAAIAQVNNRPIESLVNVEGDVSGTVVGIQIKELVIEAQSRGDTAANVTAIWQNAVRKPLQELARRPPGPSAFVLVDALDEAARAPRPNIVTLLRGSGDFPPGVRFLVTTSTVLDARELFPGALVIDLSSSESEAHANEDVRAYLRAELAATRELEDRLVEAAAGNFLYVHFLVQEVRDRNRRLEELEALEELPAGLYPLYSGYLDRVTGTEPTQRPRTRWSRELQPLIGCISVATPSAPTTALPSWLGRDPGRVNQLLTDARQLTELDRSPDGSGFRLYHRSMADYLAAPEYGSNGAATINRYHTPPETQHARIAQHYLDNYKGADWRLADSYGLRHVVRHLAAASAAERLPARKRARTGALYATVLDPGFRAAQKEVLANLHPTLADLRVAIDTALAGEEIVPLLRCVATFREVARSGVIAQGVFDAVERGDFETALRDADHYGPPPRPRGRWARVLNAWIAWQAARRGGGDHARIAAERVVGQWRTGDAEAEPLYWQLCRALLVRAGRALVARGGDPEPVIALFPRERDELTREVTAPPPPPASDAATDRLLGQLKDQLAEFEAQLRIDPFEAVEVPFANAEEQAWRAGNLRDLLISLAGRPEGRDGIDRTLAPTLLNPYPRYRDIGLVALGGAVAAVPDDAWADRRLRAILLAGLDAEGVTFTFELPTLLLEETRRRGRDAPALAGYLGNAHVPPGVDDRWVTTMRALLADAAASAASGDRDEAMRALIDASGWRPGFAGYTSGALLAIANRCVELRHPEAITEPVWGPNRSFSLVDLIGEHVRRILDYDFRAERMALLAEYVRWLEQPPPDLRAVHAFLGETPDPDARRTYKDFAAAHWVAAGTPETRDWLKSLVPMVLEDTTTLDTMLARVVGPRLTGLADDELAAAVDVVAARLTSGRPWEAAIPQRQPAIW